MKKLPEILPEYCIRRLDAEPFAVKWEELPGMLIIPRVGEKLSFGMYNMPDGRLTGSYELNAERKVIVHGVEGVEIKGAYKDEENHKNDTSDVEEHVYMAQLTDTHCRYIGESYISCDGTRQYLTFLDGDEFLSEWGIGEDNCGNSIYPHATDELTEEFDGRISAKKDDASGVAGRYEVCIGDKKFDTIRVITLENNSYGSVAVQQFIDVNGRTALWRRFNSDTWRARTREYAWSEEFPENDRLIINGKTYVNWYDCITDYIID